MAKDSGSRRLDRLSNAVRWLKPVVVTGSILLIFSCFARSSAHSQESFRLTSYEGVLPDAPQQPGQVTTSGAKGSQQQTSNASLSGTLLDTNRAVLPGVRVTLANASGSVTRNVESGSNGQFAFASLPPDVYKIMISAPGMSNFTSIQIPLHAGEVRIVPPITVSVSGGITSVTVMSGDKKELSQEQVHIAVQQRVGRVIPNFYSTYDWNAPPMEAKQKFQLSFRSIIDPVGVLAVAGIAGAEQYRGIFPAYGSGIEGYGKRFGAAFANHVSGILLGRAVYPAIFHQDPRYFYNGKGSTRSRGLYAISATVLPRATTGGGNRITRASSAASPRQPSRIFTIQLPIADLPWCYSTV